MCGARSTVGHGEHYSIEEMRSINEILYSDIVGGHYKNSWANTAYAAEKFGVERGRLLSMLYAEMRSGFRMRLKTVWII